MNELAIKELIAQGAAQSINKELGNKPFAVIPNDYKAQDLESFLNAPTRVRQRIETKTVESFTNYVKRYAEDASTIFADVDSRSFRCIIDYHDEADGPSWGDHIVNYSCPLSREWLEWTKFDRQKMNQVSFAEFLENRAADVVEPSGVELLDIAEKFQVVRKAVFGSSVRLSSGEMQFQYSETNQKGTIEIPEKFKVGVAPFHNGEKYAVEARLRYRIKEGELSLWYELVEPEKVVEDAFAAVVDQIKESATYVYEASLP